LQFRFRSGFAGAEWRLAIAVSIATTPSAAATTSTPPLAGLAFTECATFLARLCLT
jgi:hypothetical protein